MLGSESRVLQVVSQTVTRTYSDGFIHAGNLAYMAMLALFPLFILGAAAFAAIGEESERSAMIDAVLFALPPVVANVIEPVARDVVNARSGLLLWIGAAVGFWTVSSLIETIRDIIRRSYGARPALAFWHYRLLSIALIAGAVIILILSLAAQIVIGTAQQVISSTMPWLTSALSDLSLSRIVPSLGLFGSVWLLFVTLTPGEFRGRIYPKWPGAVLTTGWWLAVILVLPPILRSFFAYDLTYGSLAGIMIALFFFYLVGLGIVAGAELNAALAGSASESASGPASGANTADKCDKKTRESEL